MYRKKKEINFPDLKIKVYLQYENSLAREVEKALPQSISEIRRDLSLGKRRGELVITPQDELNGRTVSWIAYPLWWSDSSDWWKAPFPWEDPFMRRA